MARKAKLSGSDTKLAGDPTIAAPRMRLDNGRTTRCHLTHAMLERAADRMDTILGRRAVSTASRVTT